MLRRSECPWLAMQRDAGNSIQVRPRLPLTCTLLLITVIAILTSGARADIYEWQWKNPSDPSQGKIQSPTLCPGGSGVSAAPYAFLMSLDLTKAHLMGADLSGGWCTFVKFTSASLSQSDLSDASFCYSEMSGADLANAKVQGADFGSTTSSGFTSQQLYSTAS